MFRNIELIKNWILENKIEFILLLLILFLAIFLRFWRIWELQFFTYDQARDALFIKRIIIDHKLTLLGPQSSIPGIYLPPLYYYLMTIPLLLFGLNPIGLDVVTALVGVTTVFLIYYFGNLFFQKPAGFIAATAYATSPLIIELSRRAWNPNMMPFFILLVILSLYKIFKEKKLNFFYLLAVGLGFAINLHYSASGILPLALFCWVWFFIKSKNKKPIILSFIVFSLFFLPLLLFDLRHGFILTNNFTNYLFNSSKLGLPSANFFESSAVSIFGIFVTLLSGSFVQTANVPFQFWGQAFQTILKSAPISIVAHKPLLISYQSWVLVLFGVIIATITHFLIKFWKKNEPRKIGLILILVWLLVGVFVSRLYVRNFFFFYYIFLYPVPFLLLGFTLSIFWKKVILKPLILIFMIFLVYFNLTHVLVFEKPARTITDMVKVAEVIASDIDPKYTFNMAGLMQSSDRWDHNAVDYRYFVEAYFEKKALSWEPIDYRRAQKLYVVDEGGTLNDPVNSKFMEIYEFSPKYIEKTWKLENGNVIYKLGK